MKTIEIKSTGYILEEGDINHPIAQKAIEEYRYINVEHEWWYYLEEDFKTICKQLGFEVENIYWSGLYSQGDGASFTGYFTRLSDEEIYNFVNSINDIEGIGYYIIKNIPHHFTAHIERHGRYYYSNTMYIANINHDDEEENYSDARLEQIERDILQVARWLVGWYYKNLDKEYEYLTSNDAVFETLLCNEYIFDEEGRII